MATEIKNAQIKSVSLSTADHGCLSGWIHLDYGGSGQGFGGYSLFSVGTKIKDTGKNYAGLFISRCMEVAGVDEWSKMVGKTVRVKCDHGKIYGIGHILQNNWFFPKEEFEDGE